MPDHKPPRIAGREDEIVRSLLQYQRESLVRKVDGVSDDDARRSPVASGTSLLWLMQHMGDAERLWVVERFAGRSRPDGASTDTLEAAVEAYRATWALVDVIVDGCDLDQRCATEPDVNLRWVLLHLLEETARHAGHADIVRELLDGETGR